MDYQQFFQESLQALKGRGEYRYFRTIERMVQEFPYVYWEHPEQGRRRAVIWCGNDYLGMGRNPAVLNAMREALDTWGAGSGGTRNIGGTHRIHVELEETLAQFHCRESALLFTSGFVANETSLATLGRAIPDLVFLSDAGNHASMIAGIRHSHADKIIFKHNDLNDLEAHLKTLPVGRPKLIAVESVYSMDGAMAPLKEICQLAKRYNALTYVDEVHAVGLYGERGAGVIEMLGLEQEVDLICANFGKALGVIGGYVTGKRELVDFIRSFAHGFIFTTSLPPVIAAGIKASVEFIKTAQAERQAFHEIVKNIKTQFQRDGILHVASPSHIIPFIVGEAEKCRRAGQHLIEEHDIYVQPINYPTVPRGSERFRITPSRCHTPEMVEGLSAGLRAVARLA